MVFTPVRLTSPTLEPAQPESTPQPIAEDLVLLANPRLAMITIPLEQI
jgi:hypothetical protein